MDKLRAWYARGGAAVTAVFCCSAAVLGCNSVLGIEDFDAAGCPSAGARRCLDSNTPQVCGADGSWESQPDCVDQVCDGVTGACVGECAPRATRCAGDVPQVCSDAGLWEGKAACVDKTCSAELGACIGVCAAGQKKCDDNTLQLCDANGQWQDEKRCFERSMTCDAASEDGCVGVCVAGEKRCEDNALHTCGRDGQWQAQPACVDRTCDADDVEGGCVGVCAKGQKQCDVDNKTLLLCDANGQWQDEKRCFERSMTCDAASEDGCVGVCAPREKRCEDNALHTCGRYGQWQTQPACVDQTCDDEEEDGCVGVCAPGQKHCDPDNNTLQLCDTQGQWRDEIWCSDVSQTCSDTGEAGCMGVCAAGQKRCAGGVPQECEGGAWVSHAACGGATHCYGGDCVVSCAPGLDVWCFGNTPHVCDRTGDWSAGAACESQTCINGLCEGECALGDARCSDRTPQTCDERGLWTDRTACEGSCEVGSCPGPSCEGLPSNCGPAGNESCCLSPVVLGGTYQRSNMLEHPATVSDFRLDRFEITVGRFRKFVEAYPASKPVEGAGAHPGIPESGWHPDWDWYLPADRAALETALSGSGNSMWRIAPGEDEHANENKPMNSITWFEAFAFCAWDGGRLPTEAEWNYAAAGGSEQREYPWSVPPSSIQIDTSYAVHDCSGLGVGWSCGREDILNVGVKSPRGDGKWGHADLAGGLWEWNMDWYAPYDTGPCTDCARIYGGLDRVRRGGSWRDIASNLHSSERSNDPPQLRNDHIGARCVRTP
ncbi:formylglycine-generating enzyme family protein [Sorangium sp. So ce1151]|uniref:formylglycine-generating enzyme family protein n=1 Tax=Sorangium sp. So ce1151 TaxID=3133332 RepID=UPI003F63A265